MRKPDYNLKGNIFSLGVLSLNSISLLLLFILGLSFSGFSQNKVKEDIRSEKKAIEIPKSITPVSNKTAWLLTEKKSATQEYSTPTIGSAKAPGVTKTSIGSSWGNIGSWSPIGVPTSTDDVIINSNMTINSAAVCNSLTINSSRTLTINSTRSLSVGSGGIIINGTLTVTGGSSSTSTWLTCAGNFTNNSTFTETGSYSRFILNGTTSQTFTNSGTITAPLVEFGVANASGVTIAAASNAITVNSANLFYGTVTNSNKLTLGNGGSSYAVIQRGVQSNTNSVGSFDVAPNFNVGSGGLYLLYDDGSAAYTMGNEVPGTGSVFFTALYDNADVSLNGNFTTSYFDFYDNTPTLRIGANTLTIGESIFYDVVGTMVGGASSNLVLNGATSLNSIANGLNTLSVNGTVDLLSALTVNNQLNLTKGSFYNSTFLTLGNNTAINRSGGALSAAPNFAGTINLLYSGASAIATGFELPTASNVLNNITTNTGRTIQANNTGTASVIKSEGFNTAPSDWSTTILVNPSGVVPAIAYLTSGTRPTVSPSEPTQLVEFNSYDCESGDQIRLQMTTPVSTLGKVSVSVNFDWYRDNGYSTYNDFVTLQWSINGTDWNSEYTYYRYSATNGWATITANLPACSNQSSLYIAFLFTSQYGNNCHLDNFKINASVPSALTTTINGTLDVSSGPYEIGANNNLTLNGAVNGTTIIGGTSSNLTVAGTGSNLTLPQVTNGLNNFTISRSAGVTISDTRNLTVNGTLTNSVGNAALTLKSTSSGTGSLIHNTANVPATIQRYVTGSSNLTAMMYHMVSVPLVTTNNSTSNLFFGSYLFDFTQSTNSWNALGAPTNTPLDETRGYMTYYPAGANTTYSFAGSINNGSFTTLTSATAPYGANLGWNLVPNPYPSAIDWNAAAGWTKTNIAGSIYFWPAGAAASSSNYSTWNGTTGTGTPAGSRYIPIGQSFFVKANAASPVLTMNNSVRVHNTQAFYKTNEVPTELLRLKAETSIGTDDIVIHFRPEATQLFDDEYDAYKLTGGSDAPQLSSITSDNKKVSINSLPFSTTDEVVPLFFTVNTASEVTFTASGMESFYSTPPIYLEDVVENKVIDLQLQPTYSFHYTPGQENRFNLRFTNITDQDETETMNGLIYYSNKQINISIPLFETKEADVRVFDISGRLIFNTKVILNGLTQVKAPISSGVYIVRIIAEQKVISKKIIIP